MLAAWGTRTREIYEYLQICITLISDKGRPLLSEWSFLNFHDGYVTTSEIHRRKHIGNVDLRTFAKRIVEDLEEGDETHDKQQRGNYHLTNNPYSGNNAFGKQRGPEKNVLRLLLLYIQD